MLCFLCWIAMVWLEDRLSYYLLLSHQNHLHPSSAGMKEHGIIRSPSWWQKKQGKWTKEPQNTAAFFPPQRFTSLFCRMQMDTNRPAELLPTHPYPHSWIQAVKTEQTQVQSQQEEEVLLL